MAQGICATWYDLPADARDRVLAWTHDTYCPYLRLQPGYIGVAHYRYTGGGPQMDKVKATAVGRTQDAIGTGNDYLLLVGGLSAHTFFKPSIKDAVLPVGFDAMLAQRAGLRTAVFTVEAAVNGPEPREFGPDTGPGPAIQMGSFRMRTPEEEFDLGRWYAQYRLPFMAQLAGCIATRKLADNPLTCAAHPALLVGNLKELIAAAKNKTAIRYASAGTGSMTHLAAELLGRRAALHPRYLPGCMANSCAC